MKLDPKHSSQNWKAKALKGATKPGNQGRSVPAKNTSAKFAKGMSAPGPKSNPLAKPQRSTPSQNQSIKFAPGK